MLRTALVTIVLLTGLLLTNTPSGAASTLRSPGTSEACTDIGSTASLHIGTSRSVAATRAEVAAIEARLASEQICITSLSEQYDQASYRLQQVGSALASTQVRLRAAQLAADNTLAQLRSAALNAYMYDEPAQQLATFFSELTPTDSLQAAYTADALGNVAADLKAMQAATKRLSETRDLLLSEHFQAATETARARLAETDATTLTTATEAILSKVKGKLAQQVAAQATLEAEEAAQVAQGLGDGSTATKAANKAAQKAGDHSSPPSHPTGSGPGEVAIRAAESYLGVPYVWGGASRSGVDCSGLTMLSWEAAGVALVHSAALQAAMSTPVPLSELQPGDLLFYDFGGTEIDHVIMYVGSGPYGPDTIIQAAHTGTVVSFDPIWYEGLVGAGRP
jgi:cell wall-associated NlpC family hydrolase